ncbi:MAG: hypothetical protein ABR589_01300 [Chthoniobacterales bacterium]
MTLARRRLWLTCFALHLAIVIEISARDTLWLIARGYTVIPAPPEGSWQKAESIASAALGQALSRQHPLRRGLLTYAQLAGIDGSYGYFAPNVPDSYKLIFELEFSDGRVEHDLPIVDNPESTLRLATLMDQIGQLRSDPMRELLIKLLASSIWQQHPDAVLVRAILGSLTLPTVSEYEAGKRASYEFMYAYDFRVTQTD